MEKIFDGRDFGYMEKVRFTWRSETFPMTLYWMRAIDGSDVAVYQTPREHRHSFFELHFVLRGEMKYCCGGVEISVPAEHLILLPPEEPHRISRYSTDFLKFSVAFSVRSEEALCEALRLKSGRAIRLSESVRTALISSAEEAAKGTVYSPLLIRGRIFQILCEIADIREKRQGRAESVEEDIRLTKAKRFIADNRHTFLCCEDVAAYCYLSVKQLNRIFVRYETITLLSYIHQEKIRSAEELLKDRGLSVQEISDLLGFSSLSYFSAFFTKYVGMTPVQYRREFCG